MKYLRIGLISLAALSSPAMAQEKATDVNSAIAIGLKAKEPIYAVAYSGTITTGGRGFRVTAMGPLNRVHNLALLNGRKFLPYSADSVPQGITSDVVEFIAYPNAPSTSRGTLQQTEAATHMVLRPKGKDAAAIQPDSVRVFPEKWGNLQGGQFEGQGVRAYFTRSKLPPKEFDAIVVAGAEQYRVGFPPIMVNRIR